MIKKLHLKNFQGHIDNTFEFNKGLTVICGYSGAGKSSIIRALKYLLHNRPNHVKYATRPNAKFFEIEAEFDNATIKRVKGKVDKKEVNEYHVNGGEANGGITWQDVGRNVPEKVTELANIKPIVFNKELEFDIQLSQQFDGKFLLSEPDSVKLKFLNRLSGSYVVDLASKNINKELNEYKKYSDFLTTAIESLDKQLKNIVELSGPFSIAMDSVREKYDRLSESVARLEKLQALKREFDACEKERLSIVRDEELVSKVNVSGFEFAINRVEALNSLRNDFNYVQERLKTADTLLERVEGIQVDQILSKVSLLSDLRPLNADYKNTVKGLQDIEEQEKGLDKQYKDMVQCYKEQLESTSTCPYCNQKITKTCINKILKEL